MESSVGRLPRSRQPVRLPWDEWLDWRQIAGDVQISRSALIEELIMFQVWVNIPFCVG